MATNDRDYLVGSTVHLKVATREPETRAPKDPPTPPVLDSLVLGSAAVALPTTVVFAKITPGEYRFSLQTAGFAPGVYTWRARAVDEAGDVALSEDTFVLRPAT